MPLCRRGGRLTFLLLRQKQSKQKKRRPWCLRPSAALRAPCGARFKRGRARTRCAQTIARPYPLEAPLLSAFTRVGGQNSGSSFRSERRKQAEPQASSSVDQIRDTAKPFPRIHLPYVLSDSIEAAYQSVFVLPACQSTSHGSQKYRIASRFAPLFSNGLSIARLQSGHTNECPRTQPAFRESTSPKNNGKAITVPPTMLLNSQLGNNKFATTTKQTGEKTRANPFIKVTP